MNNLLLKSIPYNTRCKNLLRSLTNREITMQEFDKECAYWLIQTDVKPKPRPTRIQEMLEYDSLEYKDKRNMSPKFWLRSNIKSYLDQDEAVNNHNKGLLDKLREFKKYIPEGDTTTHSKYDMAIIGFN